MTKRNLGVSNISNLFSKKLVRVTVEYTLEWKVLMLENVLSVDAKTAYFFRRFMCY